MTIEKMWFDLKTTFSEHPYIFTAVSVFIIFMAISILSKEPGTTAGTLGGIYALVLAGLLGWYLVNKTLDYITTKISLRVIVVIFVILALAVIIVYLINFKSA
jgi:hypothetical protein